MRDVEQPRLRPGVQMLGHDAASAACGEVAGEIVLHRHGIAGERHHPGTMAAVPVVERNRVQGAWAWDRRAMRSEPNVGLRDRATRRRDAGGDDPPLSRYLRDSGLHPLLRRCEPAARSGFPEIPTRRGPCVPERFRGPVAPSAAGCGPQLSRGGCLGQRQNAPLRPYAKDIDRVLCRCR